MHKLNPFLNALAAAAYIVLIVSGVSSFEKFVPEEDTIFIPMVMLSLFVLSAAIMGFLFLGKPLQLYFDGQKQEGVVFFGKTVGFFACFAAIFIVILLTVR